MTDVFISYSRKDIAFARLLYEALVENNLETWIDWQDIPPSADWLAEVYEAIEGADAFVFIISKTSLDSEICGMEIAHAAKHHKRLIPIVIKDVEAEKVPRELSVLNWIFFDEAGEKFAEAMDDLVTAITVDQAWVKGHTRFENRALDWEKKERDRGALLRGADLSEAEAWLSGSAGKDPQPTALQTEFILKSREDATRRGRMTLIGVGAALVVAVGLGILAWTQRNVAIEEGQARATAQMEAEEARDVAEHEADARATQQAIAEAEKITAQSRELASLAVNLFDSQLDLGTLLAIESYRKEDNYLSRSSLLISLQSQSNLSRIYHPATEPRPTGGIRSVAFHPSGEYLISIDDDLYFALKTNLIRFIDLETGADVMDPIPVDKNYPDALAVSPDGSMIAVIADAAIKIFEIESGDLRISIPISSNIVYSYGLTFSPDSELILSTRDGGRIKSWRVDDGTLVWDRSDQEIFRGLTAPVYTYSPDGDFLFISENKGEIQRIDSRTGVDLGKAIDFESNYDVTQLGVSPDGKFLVYIVADDLFFWDLDNGILLTRTNPPQNEEISEIIFSPGGTYFFTLSPSKVLTWDGRTGEYIGQLFSTRADIQDFDFSLEGNLLAGASTDGTIRLWSIYSDLRENQPLACMHQGIGIAYSPSGDQLAIACEDPEDGKVVIKVFDSDTFNEAVVINRPEGLPRNVGPADLFYLDEENLIVPWTFHEQIYTYNLSQQEYVEGFIYGTNVLQQALDLSPDSKYLAISVKNEGTAVWDTAISNPEPVILNNEEVYTANTLIFNSNGSLLASGGVGKESMIHLWDVNTWEQVVAPLTGTMGNVTALSFSQNGDLLVAGDAKGRILIWAIHDDPLEVIHQTMLKGHDGEINRIIFSHDDKMFITAGDDSQIRFWDTQTQQPIGLPISSGAARQLYVQLPWIDPFTSYRGHTNPVYDIALSLDNSKLISIAAGENIKIWEMDVNNWIGRACKRAGRNITEEEWAIYFPNEAYRKTCPQYP